MEYAIHVLEKSRYILEKAIKEWGEENKTIYKTAYEDRQSKLRSLNKAIKKLES